MDRQIGRLIEMLEALQVEGAPRMWELPPEVARKGFDVLFTSMFNDGGPAMAATREISVPGRRGPIAARLYVPADIPSVSPALLYLHGGGWVIGSLDTHDRLARELAAAVGGRVLSVAYALAPEHPYPRGLDDCVDVARWLAVEGSGLGIDAEQLFIGGDSAGANLAAATLLRLRDEGGPSFRGAAYIYGAFAVGFSTPSMVAWGDRDLVLSRPVMEWFRALYLGEHASADDPCISPLRADLRGLPPAVLVVGTLDPLLSDSELFASALRAAGVTAEAHVYDGAPHGFAQMFMLDIAADAVARIGRFTRAVLG